jgi:phage-related protein
VVQWQVEFYELEDGSSPVQDLYSEQNAKVQAKFARIFDLLEEHGTSVKYPYVDSITDTKLFEMRIEQKTNIYRILYFACTGRRFILLHGFQKKTQKTLKRYIEMAESRRKEFISRGKKK